MPVEASAVELQTIETGKTANDVEDDRKSDGREKELKEEAVSEVPRSTTNTEEGQQEPNKHGDHGPSRCSTPESSNVVAAVPADQPYAVENDSAVLLPRPEPRRGSWSNALKLTRATPSGAPRESSDNGGNGSSGSPPTVTHWGVAL